MSVVIATVILLVAISLVFGYFGYPPAANNDGTWFLVPAIRFATVGQLDNPMNWEGAGTPFDPVPGGHRFLAYPPLFQIILHFFISPDSHLSLPIQVFLGIAVLNSIALAFSAWALVLIATSDGKRLTRPAVIITCLGLLLAFRASWSFNGRPEVLLRLLFTISFALAFFIKDSRRLATILGILLGLTAATHVLGPAFVFALIVFAFALRHDFWTSVRHIVTTLATGFVTFIAAMQLGPYSVSETFRGVFGVGTWVLVRDVPKKAFFTLLGNHPIALVGVVAMFFGIRWFMKSPEREKIGSPFLFILALLAAGGYLAFAVVYGIRLYYIAPFVIVAPAALLYVVRRFPVRASVVFVSVALFAIFTVITLQKLVLFPFFLRDGMMLADARAAFAEITEQNQPARIELLGSHTWTLLSNAQYDVTVPGEAIGPYKVPRFMRLIEQIETPEAPQTLGSCTLIHSFYTSKSPTMFGVPIARTTPGYNFAVYDCRS